MGRESVDDRGRMMTIRMMAAARHGLGEGGLPGSTPRASGVRWCCRACRQREPEAARKMTGMAVVMLLVSALEDNSLRDAQINLIAAMLKEFGVIMPISSKW
jgi:hypothetical protein